MEIPHHLPGIGVQSHYRRSEKIVPRTILVRDHGLRIAGGYEDQVQLWIVGNRLPRHASAVAGHVLVRPRLRSRIALLLWDGVPPPLQFTGFRIASVEIARDVEVVSADPDNEVILDDDRRDRAVVELIEIRDRLVPAFGTVLDVEADEIVVRRFEVQRLPQNGNAAIRQVIPA